MAERRGLISKFPMDQINSTENKTGFDTFRLAEDLSREALVLMLKKRYLSHRMRSGLLDLRVQMMVEESVRHNLTLGVPYGIEHALEEVRSQIFESLKRNSVVCLV